MTLAVDIDRGNLNSLADAVRLIKAGQTLSSDVKQTRRNVSMDALGRDPSDLATLDSLVPAVPAMTIFRAYARAGTAGTGEMTVAAPNVTPASGEIAVSPAGNIVTLAADAITDVDVEYMPSRGDVFEFEGDVATGVMALPAQLTDRGVLILVSAEALVGTVTGDKIVLAPAAGLPATLQARLDVAKANVQFNNATDAVTRARVTLLIAPEVELTSTLEGESNLV